MGYSYFFTVVIGGVIFVLFFLSRTYLFFTLVSSLLFLSRQGVIRDWGRLWFVFSGLLFLFFCLCSFPFGFSLRDVDMTSNLLDFVRDAFKRNFNSLTGESTRVYCCLFISILFFIVLIFLIFITVRRLGSGLLWRHKLHYGGYCE